MNYKQSNLIRYDRTESVWVCFCAARCNNNLICAWLFILWGFDIWVPKPNVTSSPAWEQHKHYVPNALHQCWVERCVLCVCRVVGGHKRTGEEDKEARRLRFQLISFRPLILELFWLLRCLSSRSGLISAEQNYRSLAPDWEQMRHSLRKDVRAQLLKHDSGMCVLWCRSRVEQDGAIQFPLQV